MDEFSALHDVVTAGRRYLVASPDYVALVPRTATLAGIYGPTIVMDLRGPVDLVGRLPPDAPLNMLTMMKLSGVARETIGIWLARGILRASVSRGRRGRWSWFSRLDGFIAGVLGALSRRQVPRATLAKVADFLYSLAGNARMATPEETVTCDAS